MIWGMAPTPYRTWEAWDRRCGFRVKTYSALEASEALIGHFKVCRCGHPK